MTAKKYIREITERSCLPRAERKKVKSDLENEINYAIERGESIEEIIERMGNPDEVAAGLYDSFIDIPARPFREYKSKSTLFGLPLVHIIKGNYATAVPSVRAIGGRVVNVGGRYGVSYLYKLPTARGVFAFGPKAKGIVSVGNLSVGFVSIGNISTGIISIGNLSAGLISIGNLALSALISLGNVAAGALTAGNVAYGYATLGNVASGEYAIGNEVRGAFTFTISNLSAQLGQIKEFIAGLDAPTPVKIFYGLAEKVLMALNDPAIEMPLKITLASVIIVIILVLWIVPNKFLNQPNYLDGRN